MIELNWRKSSRSQFDGNCVEVARGIVTVCMRDSKNPETVLRMTPREFDLFLADVKEGRYAEQ